MPKFRKIPVEIEAVQMPDKQLWDNMKAGYTVNVGPFMAVIGFLNERVDFMETASGVEIKTLEGTMLASPGDWIIRGVAGEFYPCKPEIFEATYEPSK